MNYPTRIDDDTLLLLEAEASGAFTKNQGSVEASPITALANAIDMARTLAGHLADELKPTLAEKGMDAEFTFSIKCDGNGQVMISQDTSGGQLLCRLTIRP